MENVWNVEPEGIKVFVGEREVRTVTGEISAVLIKEIARGEDIKQFGVKDAFGRELTPQDFPMSSDVYIYQINKAG